MLEDLQELSDAYISEIREMTRRGHQGITYGESETSRRQDAILRQNTNDRYKSSPTAYSTPESQSGYPPGPAYPMAPSQPSYAPQASYATQPACKSSYSTPSSQSQYPAGSTSTYPQFPGYAPVDTSRERAPCRYGYSSYGDPNEAVRKDHRPEPRLAPSVIASGPSYSDEPIRDPYRNEAVREERLPDLRGAYNPEDPYRHDAIREERRRRRWKLRDHGYSGQTETTPTSPQGTRMLIQSERRLLKDLAL